MPSLSATGVVVRGVTLTPPRRLTASFDQFMTARRFDQLDGLRAISILLVVASHMHDPLWAPLHGFLGVTVFFVISGFIITTLLIREERRAGQVSLSGFYIRRVFRIFPLYYLALAVTTIAALTFGFGEHRERFGAWLPFFATFNGDLLTEGMTFGHSWSLGVEEKFYLAWPLLAFATVAIWHRRSALAAALAMVATGLAFIPATVYFAPYAPILGGCLLATLLDRPAAFRRLSQLAHPGAAVVVVTAAVALGAVTAENSSHRPWFAVLLIVAFPALLLNRWVAQILSWRPLVYIGLRSYALYLFHPLAIRLVDKLLPPGPTLVQVGRFALALAVGLAVAELLFRLVEQPMIRMGHRVASAQHTIPSVAPGPQRRHQGRFWSRQDRAVKEGARCDLPARSE